MTRSIALRSLAGGGALLAALFIGDAAHAETPGVSGLGLDNSFRDFARASSAAGRSRADAASYATLGLSLAEPLAFDAYELMALHDARGALGAVAIDALTIALGFTTSHFVLKPAFGSAGFDNLRPMAAECLADPAYDPYCTTSELRHGNPSDHASFAAMGLGLTLGKLAVDPKFPKNPWVVGGAIAYGAAAMLATDWLRVAADKHWLSETLMGDAVGLAIGVGIPVLANALGVGYGRWQSASVQAVPTPTGFGLAFSGAI